MAVQAIMAATQLVGDLTKTVYEIDDVKKRRAYEQALGNLNFEEQKKINSEIAKANTRTERLNILAKAVGDIQQAKLAQQGKNETRLALIVIGGAVLLFAVVYFIKKKGAK